MNIGGRIREFAIYCGSLKELAEQLDMTTQSLNSYLVGKREPGAKVLSKLAKLGCNINWLLTGEGEMIREQKECFTSKLRPIGEVAQHLLLSMDGLFDLSFAKPWHWFGCVVLSNTNPEINFEKDDFLILRKSINNEIKNTSFHEPKYIMWCQPNWDTHKEYNVLEVFTPIDDPFNSLSAEDYAALDMILHQSAYFVEFMIRRPVEIVFPNTEEERINPFSYTHNNNTMPLDGSTDFEITANTKYEDLFGEKPNRRKTTKAPE